MVVVSLLLRFVFLLLLQFPNLNEIEKSLEVAYEFDIRSYPVYFQFQDLSVNISVIDLMCVHSGFLQKGKKLNG